MIRPVNYTALAQAMTSAPGPQWPWLFDKQAVPIWCLGYREAGAGEANLLEVPVDGIINLFDLAAERSLGVYGLSNGRHWGARDSSRMAGHPQSAGADYHRGHLVAHTLGGGTDINLFSQRGKLNIGEFRRLEKAAIADPGCLYFVRLVYAAGNEGQTPDWIEQGLFPSGDPGGLRVEQFRN